MIILVELFLRCEKCRSTFPLTVGDGETEVTAETLRASLVAIGEKVCQYCGWSAPIDADVITEQWLRKCETKRDDTSGT